MIDFNKINKMMIDFPITEMTISDCFGCEMKLICHSWDFMSIKTDTIEQAFEELSKFSYDEIKKSIEDHKVIVVRKRT